MENQNIMQTSCRFGEDFFKRVMSLAHLIFVLLPHCTVNWV